MIDDVANVTSLLFYVPVNTCGMYPYYLKCIAISDMHVDFYIMHFRKLDIFTLRKYMVPI